MFNREGAKGATHGGTGYTVYGDIPYVEGGGLAQSLDFYVPDGIPPKGGWPLVAYVHGGGFIAGDKAVSGNNYALLALDHGFAMASINHRLPTQMPAFAGHGPQEIEGMQRALINDAGELEDVEAALRWLVANATELGIDANRVACYGPSAGGALLAAASIKAAYDGWLKVFGMISVASATHVLDAIAYLREDSPKFYIIHGTADRIVPFHHAEAFAEALGEAGVDYVFEAVEGGDHTRPEDHPNSMTLIEE